MPCRGGLPECLVVVLQFAVPLLLISIIAYTCSWCGIASSTAGYTEGMQACNQCGKCCLNYKGGSWLGSASDQDKLFWQVLRPDILEYLGQESELWVSPVTGKKMGRCPWLRKLPNQDKYNCRIHDLRPEVCKNFPMDIEQMIQVDCEMLEEGDLEQPHVLLTTRLAQLNT